MATIQSNIEGIEMHGPVSTSQAGITFTLPTLCPRLRPRTESVFRDPAGKRGLKSEKRGNLIDIPRLDDYVALTADPGTSSMGLRCERLVNGHVEKLYHWDTIDFVTDSSVLIEVQRYVSDLFEKYKPDILFIELQISKFGIEYTQHTLINVALIHGIPVVTIQPGERYTAYGIEGKDEKKLIAELGVDMLEEEGDEASLSILSKVKRKKTKSGVFVSAEKTRSDLLDTVSLARCCHGYLVQACMQVAGSSTTVANDNWIKVGDEIVKMNSNLQSQILSNGVLRDGLDRLDVKLVSLLGSYYTDLVAGKESESPVARVDLIHLEVGYVINFRSIRVAGVRLAVPQLVRLAERLVTRSAPSLLAAMLGSPLELRKTKSKLTVEMNVSDLLVASFVSLLHANHCMAVEEDKRVIRLSLNLEEKKIADNVVVIADRLGTEVLDVIKDAIGSSDPIILNTVREAITAYRQRHKSKRMKKIT